MVFICSNLVLIQQQLFLPRKKQQQLFLFAKNHRGSYDGECPFYCSYSGYNVSTISSNAAHQAQLE
jgi:hypothetical protein